MTPALESVPFFALSQGTLLAIAAMAGATALTRLAGLVLIRHVALGSRLRRAMRAIPPAVLMAVITPTALATGPAETAATVVTALAATRLPLLGAVATGVLTVAMLRAAGI
ncbi:putative membrane protein [Rhizobium sp. PP-CC-3A-592]|nr:putative membrane protein [Rhizobium sp. PP-CC-3A-592]